MVNSWNLILFAACAIAGAAAAMAVSIGEWRGLSVPLLLRTALAGAVLIAAGGVAAMISLGRPALIFGALANPNSGIFRELVTTSAAVAFLLLYAAALWRGATALTCRVLSAGAGLAGLASAAAVGSALYMPWHAGWHTLSIALPPPCWALAAAAALAAALFSIENDEEGGEDEWLAADTELAGKLVLPASLLPAAGVAAYLAVLAWGPAPNDSPTVSRLLAGDLAVPFWAGTVVLGLVVPPAAAAAAGNRASGLLRAAVVAVASVAAAAAFEWTISQLGASVWHFFAR